MMKRMVSTSFKLGPSVIWHRNWFVPFVRMVILAVMTMALIFYYTHLPTYYWFLVQPGDQIAPGLNWGPTQLQYAVEQAGHSITLLALLSTLFFGLMTTIYAGVGFLLLLRKPQDLVAVVTAITLVWFGTGFPPILNIVSTQRPELERIMFLWGEGGFTILFILFLIFPDGHFRPRWTALVALYWGLQPIIVSFWPESPLLVYSLPQPWGSLGPLLFLGSFVAALLYRYFALFNHVQRQQTKWAVSGMSFVLVFFLGFLAYYYSNPQLKENTPEAAVQFHIIITGLTLIFTIIPVTLGIAILRHRLWDIDLIIRRTLSYSLITATLLLVYFGIVIIFQVLTERILQWETSQLGTVISTLTIAALFNPLRRRVQSSIDKRFNRRKFNALEAITGFSARMQSEVELAVIKTEMLRLVHDSIQPSQVSIWIKNDDDSLGVDRHRNGSETPPA
jgi:hypothetical protein